jgi:DNA-binding NarL/FixJ family response regulator
MIIHSLREIGSIAVLAAFAMLTIGHVFLFIGRKSVYYVRFALYTSSLVLFILTCIELRFLFISKEIDLTWIPIVSSFAFIGIFINLKYIFHTLLDIQTERKHTFLPFYSALLVSFILSFGGLIDREIYAIYIMPISGIFGSFAALYLLVYFTFQSIKTNKIADKRKLLVLVTALLLYFELFLEAGSFVFHFNYPFKDLYIITFITVVSWAFLQIAQFNKEHFQLIQLKQELDKKVKERTEQLIKVNKDCEQSYFDLAHQTKTPLTLINNYFEEYVSRHGLSNEMIIVKKNIDQLNEVIHNYFNKLYSSIDKDYAQDVEITDINELIEYSVQTLTKNDADAKNKFNLYLEENHIRIDKYPNLDTIMLKLLTVGLSLSTGNKTIQVKQKKYENNIFIELVLDDVFINDTEITKMFSRKIDNPFDSSEPIDMAVVKEQVEDFSGAIRCVSSVNGTSFQMSLPGSSVDIIQNKTIINDSRSLKPNELGRILLVDDSEEMIYYLNLKLQEHYEVTTAINGKDALEKLKEIRRPDLIISDIMMDQMDGMTFYKELRSDNRLNSVPFIFLTAKSSKSETLEGLESGAVDYITKPFDFKELKLKVESIISQHKRFRENIVNSAIRAINEELDAPTDNSNAKSELNYASFSLTSREIDIVERIKLGDTNKQIAQELHIAETTVAKHVRNIFEKTSVKNRIDLINKLS